MKLRFKHRQKPVDQPPPTPAADASADHLVPLPISDIYPATPGSPTDPTSSSGSGIRIGPPPPPTKKRWRDDWRSIASTVALILLAPLIAWSISAFGLQSYQVDGQSMETTLQDKDRLIVNKLSRTLARVTHHARIPARGDIIVFNARNLPGLTDTPKQLIKRVIALPGERVVVAKGKVTVYNAQNPKGFDPDNSGLYTIATKTTSHDVDYTLKDGELFVLGDNRPNSEDSRFFGPISADDTVGELVLRILPLNKAQRF